MKAILNLWEIISHTGTVKELSASDTKRLILTNRFGIIAVFFTFPYILGFFYGGYYMVALFSCLCCIIYFSVPFFNTFYLYTTSKLVLYLGVLVHQFVLASIFGESAGIHYMYIALILLPIVLFDIKKQIGLILFCIVITIFATLVLYFTQFSLLLDPSIPFSAKETMDILYKITTVIGCFVILFSSIIVATETEKFLDDSNLFLQYQMKAIFDNSHDAIFLVESDVNEIIKVNYRAQELFEVDSEQDLIGKIGLDLHKNKPTEKEINQIRSTLLESGSYHGEVSYKTGKGNEFWGSIAVKTININSKSYFTVRITDITERYELNAKIKSSLLEKETLLAEIHHRVKNNLAVISGLLGLQSSYIENADAKKAFEECRNRIQTMALIHDKLYHNETLSKIDFCEYINDLVRHIKNSYNPAVSEIEFSVMCHETYLDIGLAVPCGLILNELISNAYKHAFKGKQKGKIKIVCSSTDKNFTLMVSDDGLGFDMEKALIEPRSLGLTLVKTLVGQINGDIKTTFNEGTAFYISFVI
ncbi:MAG: histidine kinase dimerization/phosphoacceptor domain -containing protein [Bacteroidota bacterium]